MFDKFQLQEQLYLVASPIGNLRDITLRALQVLRGVDFIAAEDTRRTSLLLQAYGISKPLLSYHEHNQKKAGAKILELLNEGKKVALVSDAGMPAISDPGRALILEAIKGNISYTVIPGPSAGITALVMSGFATDTYTFYGFLPLKNKLRSEILESAKVQKSTLVFYEAPHRLLRTLEDLAAFLGQDRQTAILRELTKVYEEVLRGSLEDLIEVVSKAPLKGEIVIVTEGLTKIKVEEPSEEELLAELGSLIETGWSKSRGISLLSKKYSLSKQELYRFIEGKNRG